MVSNRRLILNANWQRKRYGFKLQNNYAMRFPEIVEKKFEEIWRDIQK